MRHVRARRRFKLTLSLLLALCFLLFFEQRIEAFVPQLKNFAEVKLEKTFDSRFKLSIGSIDGGILNPFILNDIKIKDKKNSPVFSSLAIRSIKTNYRIWDVFLKSKEASAVSRILGSNESGMYINFTIKDKDISGFARFEGDFKDSNIKGYVNIGARERIDFSGRISEDSFDLEIKPSAGVIKAAGSMAESNTLILDLGIEHLKLYGFDIVCEARLKSRIVTDNPRENYLGGEFETKNLILNYKPFLNLNMSYKISDGVLNISRLDLGESIRASGSAFLRKPYEVDIAIFANNLSLNWLMLSLGAVDGTSILSGTMNGKLEMKGPADRPKLTARIELKKGTISDLDFEYLSANLKGEYPFLRIEDSRITRDSGYFALAGEMDLRKFGKAALFNDIKISGSDKAVTWDGWDTAKIQDVQELRMRKRLSEDINIDCKKFINEQKVDESIRDTDEVGFEYKLHPNDSLKVAVGEDSDFFGLEHKNKF